LKEKVETTTKSINVFQIIEMDKMEQRSVVLFLRLKDLSRKPIYHELVGVFQENTVSYSSMTRFYSAGRLFWA
jgi:transposase